MDYNIANNEFMGFIDWIEQRRRGLFGLTPRAGDELLKHTERLLRQGNFSALSTFLRQHRESKDIVSTVGSQMAQAGLIYTPADAMNRGLMELMDTFRASRFMQEKQLQWLSPNHTPDDIDGMIAMYLFMRNAACCRYPVSCMQRPEAADMEAAAAILDDLYHDRSIRELTDLMLHKELPSEYVALRCGMSDDCSMARYLQDKSCALDDTWMEESPAEVQEDLLRLTARLERAAENALEAMTGGQLPAECLERLNRDLRQLQSFPYISHRIDHSEESRRLHYKYGICMNASREKQSRQVEDAFRELDGRLSRLTGLRPYADDLFESLKRKEAKDQKLSSPKRRPKADMQPEADTPAQTQGRKIKR